MKVETIAEQLYFTTILIESQNDSGETAVGTGFIIDAGHESRHAIFLATNKHVVTGGKTGTLRFHLKAAGIPCQGQGYKLKVPDFAQY
ncbi:MAG: serine protease, partial [Elusimicrobiota bacterium]